MYPEIPALCFISAALSLIPLTWYLHAHNIAAMAIGIWLSVTNITYAVNALVWDNNTDIKALVWCDISTNVITASRIALPAACLSICIHLERLASFCQTSAPQVQRRRIIFECLMCFGLPLLYIALHLIVQARRFDLYYGFGCRPATHPGIATIFLVMIPPLLLTAATIACTGMAWRHFLPHGVQFYGKRGSVSSLTCNLYLRLIGMALFEAVCSAVLVTIVIWSVLYAGLAPLGNTSRDLSEVVVRGPGTITDAVYAVLHVEWSMTVVQSVVFFGLFACRMNVVREGWEVVRWPLQFLRTPNASGMHRRGTSEQLSTSSSITVSTLPLTEVDLSLVIQSASTLTPYGHSADKPLTSMPGPSHPITLVEDAPENAGTSANPPAMISLESPPRPLAIASSHNSLESNFDPSRLNFSPYAWPQTPTAIPRCSFSIGYGSEKLEESWFDMDVPFPWAKVAAHVKSRAVDPSGQLPRTHEAEKRHAIYVTVVRATQ